MKRTRFSLSIILLTGLLFGATGCSLFLGTTEEVPTPAILATVPPADTAEIPVPTTAPETVAPLPTATLPATIEAESEPTLEPTPEIVVEPTTETEPPAQTIVLPDVVEYNLGDAVIIQDWFEADRLIRGMPAREMPVRLNGIISVPIEGEGPFPVVLILHGTHPGCPTDETGSVDFWPCDPEQEQPNYRGFDYLVQRLAAEGYVALAPNINAVNTFGYGEASGEEQIGARLSQLVDLHMRALAAASTGGVNNFGVELENKADMRRLAYAGHSRGGEYANWLIGNQGLNSPLSYANLGYGPVRGLLLIAPAVASFRPVAAGVPLAIVLPACDGDVITQEGQLFYETIRLTEGADEWTTSAWLEAANHNQFNSILGSDMIGHPDRPECQPLLAGDVQREFMANYATDFLTTLFSQDPQAILAARDNIGVHAPEPAPADFYGLAGRVKSLAAGEDRLTLLLPADETELATNRLGGAVTTENVALTFCPAGYYFATDIPGTEPCRRTEVTIPGDPSLMVVTWESEGGVMRVALPPGEGDLSRYQALSLRAGVDPLSPLNDADSPQAFSVRLTDSAGNSAVVATSPAEPSLQFPQGLIVPNDIATAAEERFTGRVPLTTLRLPLAAFDGVDLTAVSEIALVFDQTPDGALFLADLELVRSPHIIGAYSSLLENAGATHDNLKSVARFNGASSCTGTFINSGGDPEAPAYLLTNGHCAQDWDANAVIIDQAVEGWEATFNYFIDTVEDQVVVPAVRVAYSTMKGRDIALVELDATVGELAARGIVPLDLATSEPEGAWSMRVVGAPVTNVPPGMAYLREEVCAAGARADLFEFIWHFDDTFRNSCQDIYGGSSGSPVFVDGGTAIVGLINTTNLGAITPCYLGAPCEATANGTDFLPDTSYATPVVGLDACFNAYGTFTLAAEDCPLDDGRQLLVSASLAQGTQPFVTGPDGSPTPVTWNASVSGDLPYYRYKSGRAGQVNCAANEGYGPPIAQADLALINDPLPADEGSYLLCVVAGESPVLDDSWQTPDRATIVRAAIDTTAPTVQPTFNVMADQMGGFMVDPIFAIAELIDYRLKAGPAAEIDCAVDDGYLPYRRFPIAVPADQIPARVCVIGADYAGNEAPPYELLLGQPE